MGMVTTEMRRRNKNNTPRPLSSKSSTLYHKIRGAAGRRECISAAECTLDSETVLEAATWLMSQI